MSPPMSNPSLLERVEAATGADVELDARIWCALVTGETWSPEEFRQSGDEYIVTRWNVPAYTASLDAALSLVERVLPGWGVNLSIGPDSDPGCIAALYHDEKSACSDKRPTPALALLAALLRATEEKPQP